MDAAAGTPTGAVTPSARQNRRASQRARAAAYNAQAGVSGAMGTAAAARPVTAAPGAPGQQPQQPAAMQSESVKRRADLYAVGRFMAITAQRERQGASNQTMLMTKADGMPIKEALQAHYRLTRDKTIKDAGIFVLWSSLLMAIAFSVYDVHTAYMSSAGVQQRVTTKAFPGANWRKTFFDALQVAEMMNFMYYGTDGDGNNVAPGPLLSELFPTAWYDGVPLQEWEQPYMLEGAARVMGGVQVRFYRAAPNTCVTTRGLPGIGGTCYAAFTASTAFTGLARIGNSVYNFGTDHGSNVEGWYGALKNMVAVQYGKVAYSVVLPAGDVRTANATLSQWRNDGLVGDGGVRAISMTWNAYNTNTRYMTVTRLLFELVETSNVVPSAQLYTVPVPELFLTSSLDQLMLVLLVFYMCGWIYFAQKEMRRLYWSRSALQYISAPPNLFEFVLLIVTSVFIGMYCAYLATAVNAGPIDVNGDYVDLFDRAVLFNSSFVWAGLSGLLCALKMFRFLSISKRMNTLWLTLERAAADLASYVVALLLCLLGFGFAAQHSFGQTLKDFKDFSSATVMLFRTIQGEAVYDNLSLARPWISWVFYALYVSIVNIIVINIIIAIVVKYYAEVNEEVKRVDKWKEPTARMEQVLLARVRRWGRFGLKRLYYSCCCCASRHGMIMFNHRRLLWCEAQRAGLRKWRSVRTRMAWCGSRVGVTCCTNAASAEAGGSQRELQAEGGDATVVPDAEEEYAGWEVEDKLEAHTLEMTRAFLGQLKVCSRLAKRVNNINLFSHLERLYEDISGSDSLFITVHEICCLLRKRPCNPSAHRECEARSLVEAFHRMKFVLMTGRVQSHKPITDDLTEKPETVFPVEVRTRMGFKEMKKIVVAQDRGLVLVFRDDNQLERTLPLSQLIQIEKSMASANQLSLIFTSQGVPSEEEEVHGSMELNLRIVFKAEMRRDEFLSLIMSTQETLLRTFDAIMGPSSANAMASHAAPQAPASLNSFSSVTGASFALPLTATPSTASLFPGSGGVPATPQAVSTARPSLAATLSERMRAAAAMMTMSATART